MSTVSFARAAAAVAVLTVFASPALSADLYGRQPYPPPAQPYAGYTQQSPVANWAGAYLGLHAGYAFGSLANSVNGLGTLNSSINGAQIGIYGGINAVLNANIIIGAEADLNLSDQRQTQTSGTDQYRGASSWNGTIRGRLGTTFDRFMPFVTGGLAFANQRLSVAGAMSQAMVKTMAKDPIIFAMANPDPEITPEEVASEVT